jgi:hypothetical protein
VSGDHQHNPSIARHVVTERALADARGPSLNARQLRVMRFIDVQRLSRDEAAYLEPDFDPGPEYDL